MAASDIEVHNRPDAQRFEARLGDEVAFADYHLKNRVIIFTHTEVPEALEGQGVASRLIRVALEHSREQGYQVVPLCPFVAAYIRRHPEYRALVLPRFAYMVA